MPTMTMTVKYINAPKPGKQRGSIKGADDQILGIFADKLGLFEPGRTYEIEYIETASNGVTYRNVKSAKPIETATPAAAHTGVGIGPTAFNAYRETSPVDSKRMFVCATLTAMIRAGEVKKDRRDLWEATQMLCGLYEATFGETSTFRASETQRAARS